MSYLPETVFAEDDFPELRLDDRVPYIQFEDKQRNRSNPWT
jgi:hypothetical protein